jgi:hypothetical protein
MKWDKYVGKHKYSNFFLEFVNSILDKVW